MANEALDTIGSFNTVQASNAPADGALSTGTRTTITTALGATESKYPLLDFKLAITSGTISADATCELYFRPSDGTDESPAPNTTDFLSQYRGVFLLDGGGGASEYYLYGVRNDDPEGTYYWRNMDGTNALTGTLYARGRTVGTA